MGDRTSASISIGGALPVPLIPELIEMIERDGGRSDWEGPHVKSSDIVTGQVLEVHALDLNGGTFEATEDFCVLNALSFVRTSGSCNGVYGPEKVVHRGDGHLHHFELGEAGDILFSLGEIQSLGTIEAIKQRAELARYAPPPIIPVGNTTTGSEGGPDNG